MPSPAKGFAVFLVVLALAGCAGHTHQLASSDGLDYVTGSFSHEGSQEPLMVLDINGARYEGRGFAIKRWQNMSELRKMFGPGKHYDQINSGMDTYHITYSAAPELRSENGETIRCLLAWQPGHGPSGVCTQIDGKQIEVRSN